MSLLQVKIALAESPSIQPLPFIAVTGSAEIEAQPDYAVLVVAVESRNIKLDLARTQNDQRVTTILKFLREQGIVDKDISTDRISLNPVYYESKQREKLDYYQIIKNINIKIHDLNKLDFILARLLVSDGISNIESLNFYNSEIVKYRQQARSAAARDASVKADLLCQDLSVKRGRPLKIIELEVNDQPNFVSRTRSMQNVYTMEKSRSESTESGPGSFVNGQIKIRAALAIDFLIE